LRISMNEVDTKTATALASNESESSEEDNGNVRCLYLLIAFTCYIQQTTSSEEERGASSDESSVLEFNNGKKTISKGNRSR
jgi:hypothetical protein